MVPAGWKVSDSTQLSYGQALLTKIAPEGAEPPNDTSVLLGRLDLKLFAGAETDNTKAAQRLASDMGEFFMPFPGTRMNQETIPLDANGMPGVASYYEVKFTDTNKPTGQIWAGVVGEPVEPGTPRGQRTPQRWFVVWLGTDTNPIPREEAITLANSIRPYAAPVAVPPPAPGAPPAPAPRRRRRRLPIRTRRRLRLPIRTRRRLRLHLRPSGFPYRWRRRMRQECCRPADQQGLAMAQAQRGVNAPSSRPRRGQPICRPASANRKMDRQRLIP